MKDMARCEDGLRSRISTATLAGSITERSGMLRVTVTRESANDVVPIGEVVIGKFAGTEARGGYAARVLEPPSQYSEGTDACFTIQGHERYQPAMALVASVMAAWREGRIDEVGEGLRRVLRNIARKLKVRKP